MSDVSVAARLILAAIFAVAGVAKLMDRDGARKAVAAFGVPPPLVTPAATALPIIELATAVALVMVATAVGGAIAAAILLILFIVGIGVSLSRGRQPDCRCFGQLHSAPVSWRTLARNTALLVGAALVVVNGPGPGVRAEAVLLSGIQWVALFVVVVLVVAFVLEGRQLVARLRPLLPVTQPDRTAQVQRGDQPAATSIPPSRTGLPIGTPAPDFALRDRRGNRVTLPGLQEAGHPVLLIFTDPVCASCLSLLPEIERWQTDHGTEVTIALILLGTTKSRSRVTSSKISRVLLEEDAEVADAYRFSGAPSAVIIGVDGRIASSMVVGADAIGQLVESVVPRSYPQLGTKLGRT